MRLPSPTSLQVPHPRLSPSVRLITREGAPTKQIFVRAVEAATPGSGLQAGSGHVAHRAPGRQHKVRGRCWCRDCTSGRHYLDAAAATARGGGGKVAVGGSLLRTRVAVIPCPPPPALSVRVCRYEKIKELDKGTLMGSGPVGRRVEAAASDTSPPSDCAPSPSPARRLLLQVHLDGCSMRATSPRVRRWP